jgi:DNA-binding NtrC family response regulator
VKIFTPTRFPSNKSGVATNVHFFTLRAIIHAKAPMRRSIRVPLYTRVTTDKPELGILYSWNVSEGGMQLRAPEAPVELLSRGARVSLSFILPDAAGGSPVQTAATVMWADPHARDHQGRRSLAVGVKFDEAHEVERDRVKQFVDTFRYRVVVFGFEDPGWIFDAIGTSFELVPAQSEASLHQILSGPHVGLVVLGSKAGDAGTAQLAGLLESELEIAPPIIYVGQQEPSPAQQQLISHSSRVAYLPASAPAFALHVLTRRLVEMHTLTRENELLTHEIERTVAQLRDENQSLRRKLVEPARLPGIVGQAASMQRVFDLAERVAPLDTTVLIRGESGTGKELFARALHALSPRAAAAFVAQNCAALPDALLDSELFGHARGAFTGAIADRPGLFETARGGTVFLDEVGEMTPNLQAKLLRVLEEREVRRVGATKSTRLDVRLICATHRDLQAMVKTGTFREDLFYRLAGFVLPLPPLRERKDDLAALAMHFLTEYAKRHKRATPGFTPVAMRVLENAEWPGNVRELAHVVERLVVLCEPNHAIDAALVQETLGLAPTGDAAPAPVPSGGSIDDAVSGYERALIVAALDRAGGVLTKAAIDLRVDRTTLSKRCKRLGIQVGR